ncbi:ribosomal protein S18-alanine N-acetyltransferase [Priestia taiwanensis]|uniref:[Ribosomal protein bS18]-alanine N-acetyltransferase n=1 Tax=Priestia taiwanensis TaxID=1347902 RepID=A0A917AX45_9BACI|nr:ribosomal protein S18-alanine N-acetyltransferase [Priestia taiwanensis]MBM7365307.1 ribosomal-protein-alanine N-acetyltransferase [Priestia taiwanensis]GGE86081.1 ribosomal-protein-alanine acetyltransferase [Priestia taiwanensis]
MDNKVTCRPMTLEDVDTVDSIEQVSFAIPWTREAFVGEVTTNPFAHYTVMECEGEIIGYCGLWIVVDEASITNIAILPSFRGKKLGELLLMHVMNYAKEHNATTLSLEVRISNEVAQNLYRKVGFCNGGIRKNYYSNNNEDALVMWVNIK